MLEAYWQQLRKWNAEAAAGAVGKDGKHWLVFLGDMCDIFDDEGLTDQRNRMWAVVKACTSLTFLTLTKRPQNFAKYLPADWGEGYSNVWLGVTVDDRKNGYPRVDILRETPAVVRFLSCEPLLEDISDIDLSNIDWAIVGGESGPGSREFDLEWARSLRDRCLAKGTAFFMKQLGQKPSESGDSFRILNNSDNGKRDLHGKSSSNFPEDLKLQQWPGTPQAAGEPRLLQFPTMSGPSDAPDIPGLTGAQRDRQPTQPEKRHQAALKAWQTRRANADKVRHHDAFALPAPVRLDKPKTEMQLVLRWLSSKRNADGPLGYMASSAIASLTGMLSYMDTCKTADSGGAA
jgi:protein gp37